MRKEEILKFYPNAKCVWRDGARITYEIWEANKKLSNGHHLTARGAWGSIIINNLQLSPLYQNNLVGIV